MNRVIEKREKRKGERRKKEEVGMQKKEEVGKQKKERRSYGFLFRNWNEEESQMKKPVIKISGTDGLHQQLTSFSPTFSFLESHSAECQERNYSAECQERNYSAECQERNYC